MLCFFTKSYEKVSREDYNIWILSDESVRLLIWFCCYTEMFSRYLNDCLMEDWMLNHSGLFESRSCRCSSSKLRYFWTLSLSFLWWELCLSSLLITRL